jgi:hypothetical protein
VSPPRGGAISFALEPVMAPAPPNKKRTPRSRNLFRKTEIRRAIATAQAAGFSIQRIDVDSNGKFSVVLGPPALKDTGARP